ncbi:hypothetical protein B0T11DRAFT_20551 [Plectosphaerella cucumerina]|uniref:Major facilitator superfamily transporter n=1 Tax=Plectosphaerella cucumerina TaxID=40658 RepID=A0A8K0X906_9PEZI|nr:hypothetical protein B0T11DRAFT_20551 [Plectosphaerella cucumerina]
MMERVSSFLSARSSRSNSGTQSPLHEKSDSLLLPLPQAYSKSKAKLRMRTLLGNSLYRRLALWAIAIFMITSVLILKSGVRSMDSHGSHSVDVSDDDPPPGPPEHSPEGDKQPSSLPSWIVYEHLNGYFNGLKSLVPLRNHTPEWPIPDYKGPIRSVAITSDTIPKPKIYRAQPDFKSEEYLSKHYPVEECYLDEHNTPAPDIYAFDGLPQHQPNPAIGSYDLLGLRQDICFDRFSRYGPYGLGYGREEGGTGEGIDTDMTGASHVWEKTGRINYNSVDWGDAQERCNTRNARRFIQETDEDGVPIRTDDDKKGLTKIERKAVLVRTYVGFRWTQHVILNFRAMISELNLKSGGEYTVHFLVHVKDLEAPIWADPRVVQDILDANVPAEFHSICSLWSEAQMRLYYPGPFTAPFENPSKQDIHGVYRSAHFPMQVFALQHPEYSHFWNWELDMRWTGSYYELFDRTGEWAKAQSRTLLWERSAKYYIPPLHGSWDNFSRIVEKELQASGRQAVMGPALFPGRQPLFSETTGRDNLPKSCGKDKDPALCGVGEEADIITLNPLFDANESGWVFSQDVTGYNTQLQLPPRRCAIVTASRLSRRLIMAMHEETWRHHHSMFSEMFPPAMALHHGMKAAYAPHPVFLDRGWDYKHIEAAFNGGRDGTSGGPGSPFDMKNEHNHKGTTWYFNSEFAGLLWRRWLGYPQMDGRGDNGGRAGQGTLRGGKAEEESDLSSGRLCLRSMLVHPIKFENPAERA